MFEILVCSLDSLANSIVSGLYIFIAGVYRVLSSVNHKPCGQALPCRSLDNSLSPLRTSLLSASLWSGS